MIVHSGTQNRALDKRTARNNHPVCSRHMPVECRGEATRPGRFCRPR
jgi:hypothetical protein